MRSQPPRKHASTNAQFKRLRLQLGKWRYAARIESQPHENVSIEASIGRNFRYLICLRQRLPSSRDSRFEALQIFGGVGEKIGTIRGKGRRKGGLIACITARNRGMSRSKAAMRVGIARRGVLLPAGK